MQLAEADGEVPAEAAFVRFGEDAGVLFGAPRGPAGPRCRACRALPGVAPTSALTVARPSEPKYHCGGGRRLSDSVARAPSSTRMAREFSSAEKNSINGRTPRASASFSTESSCRASARPLTKVSNPGSSPSTTRYMEAAMGLVYRRVGVEDRGGNQLWCSSPRSSRALPPPSSQGCPPARGQLALGWRIRKPSKIVTSGTRK